MIKCVFTGTVSQNHHGLYHVLVAAEQALVSHLLAGSPLYLHAARDHALLLAQELTQPMEDRGLALKRVHECLLGFLERLRAPISVKDLHSCPWNGVLVGESVRAEI